VGWKTARQNPTPTNRWRNSTSSWSRGSKTTSASDRPAKSSRELGTLQSLEMQSNTARRLEFASARAGVTRNTSSKETRLLIENKYAAIAAGIGFVLTLWLTDGSMTAAFGVLALIAGIGWAVRRLQRGGTSPVEEESWLCANC